MSTILFRGDLVTHARYGRGTVLDAWGSWFSCRSCYVELPIDKPTCDECRGRNIVDEEGNPPAIFQVSGKGIYDVRFADGKTRAIHRHWLILT